MQASSTAADTVLQTGLQALHIGVGGLTEVMNGVKLAAANSEARYMLKHLSGAEASRRFACALQNYVPHGAPNTWRKGHSEREIEELKGHWAVACICRRVRPSERLWRMISEGGYQRATEEQDAAAQNSYGEMILLQDKITFWRNNIPAAAGLPLQPNLVEEQRQLQLTWYAADGMPPPAVLLTDLCGWRQSDLQAWTAANPGRSMSQP